MSTLDKIKELMDDHRLSNGRVNGSAIARALGVNPSTVTRHIAKLENEALLNRDGKFKVHPSHNVKGVSVLVDADGNIKQQWVKTSSKVYSMGMKAIILVQLALIIAMLIFYPYIR